MSDKLHGLTGFVQLRVTTELRLDRNRPRQALWPLSLFGAEICKYSCGYLGPTAWGKQAEMSYRVAIAFGDVSRPAVDKLLNRALHHDRELYHHANQPIFLLLIVGGEGVLVQDDNRGVRWHM